MKARLIWNVVALFLSLGCSDNSLQPANKSEEKQNMSSTVLKLIPTDPNYVPNIVQQDNAKTYLTELYRAKEIEFVTSDTIEFVDQGENFDSVSCNLCGRQITIEDWQYAMDKGYEKQFADLTFVTPCCSKTTSLNDLTYHSAAGFSRFIITISDAEKELAENELNKLQQIINTRLRIIWAHY